MVSYKVQYCFLLKVSQVAGLLFASMLLGPLIAPPIGGFLAARCALQPTDHRNTWGPSLAKSARSHDGLNILNAVALPKRGSLVAWETPFHCRQAQAQLVPLQSRSGLAGVPASGCSPVCLVALFLAAALWCAKQLQLLLLPPIWRLPGGHPFDMIWLQVPMWQGSRRWSCFVDSHAGSPNSQCRTLAHRRRFLLLLVMAFLKSTFSTLTRSEWCHEGAHAARLFSKGSSAHDLVVEVFWTTTTHLCWRPFMVAWHILAWAVWAVSIPIMTCGKSELSSISGATDGVLIPLQTQRIVDLHAHVAKIRCSLARRIWGLPIEQASFLVSLLAFSGEVECIRADTGVVLWIGLVSGCKLDTLRINEVCMMKLWSLPSAWNNLNHSESA